MEEKSKLDKLKKGIGVGILAGALGLGNVSGAEDHPYFIDDKEGTKIETSIQNSILANKEIELEFEDDVYYPDAKIPPREYFEKHINKMTVDDSVKPLLVDILMRRSLEYGLSRREIKKDINRLVNNVDEIIVDNNEGKTWDGQNDHLEKTIRLGTTHNETIEKFEKEEKNRTEINKLRSERDKIYLDFLKEKAKTDKDYMNLYEKAKKQMDNYSKDSKEPMSRKYNNIMYETLTHEVYHALAYDTKKQEYDLDNNSSNTDYRALHEVIVEKAADRATVNREYGSYSLPHDNSGTTGYTYSTFITDVMESIYGITEKEFLGSAIKGGKDNLIKTLAKNANENTKETEKFINSILTPFNKQFYERYYKDKNGNITDVTNVRYAMADIYKVSIDKMNSLAQNKKITNLKDAKEYVENLKYNYAKLNNVMKNSLDMQNMGFVDIYEQLIPNKAALENKIHNMNEIIKYKDVVNSDELILSLFNEAKDNRISDDNHEKLSKELEKINEKNIKEGKEWEKLHGGLPSFPETYNLNITDCKYWEEMNNKENMFWNIPNWYRDSESKEKYKEADFHRRWDNEEINQKMGESYKKMHDEHVKEGVLKKAWRYTKGVVRAIPSIPRAYYQMFQRIYNRLAKKEEPLMLNSGEEEKHIETVTEEKPIKTAEDERREFMEKIKVDVDLSEINLESKENDTQVIDRTQEDEGFER